MSREAGFPVAGLPLFVPREALFFGFCTTVHSPYVLIYQNRVPIRIGDHEAPGR
jgi:hypothetical protein